MKWEELPLDSMVHMYNYPWSGYITGHINCCLYCGDDGSHYRLSSHSGRCLGKKCRVAVRNGAKPIPELFEKMEKDFDRLVREWCAKNYINYDATVKNFEDNLGPQENTRQRYMELKEEGKIDKDYTVHLDRSEVRKITEPFEQSILELAETMVAEKRAEGWKQADFANALKEMFNE